MVSTVLQAQEKPELPDTCSISEVLGRLSHSQITRFHCFICNNGEEHTALEHGHTELCHAGQRPWLYHGHEWKPFSLLCSPVGPLGSTFTLYLERHHGFTSSALPTCKPCPFSPKQLPNGSLSLLFASRSFLQLEALFFKYKSHHVIPL